jgi:hypothetical protein
MPTSAHPLLALLGLLLALTIAGPAAAQGAQGSLLDPPDSPERLQAVIESLEAQEEMTRTLLTAAVQDYQRAVRMREAARARLREAELSLDRAVASEQGSAASLDLAMRQWEQAWAEVVKVRPSLERHLNRVRTLLSELTALQVKVADLRSSLTEEAGPLSGVWDVTLMPSNVRGVFVLRQQGTLVTGQYRLAGGWIGSLRGTFVSGEIQLERIDSQRGRDAELRGTLAGGGGRIRGTWHAFELADGNLPHGTWVAVRRP